jgi:hypothetical protein
MRRSRKPVWAFRSIGGSNPPLSVLQPVFHELSRDNEGSRTVAAGIARGSTQASVGPTLRGFVPSTFPPNVAEFVPIEPSTGEFHLALETHIGEQCSSLVGEQSMLARTSAGRHIIVAGHRRGRPFQEVVG